MELQTLLSSLGIDDIYFSVVSDDENNPVPVSDDENNPVPLSDDKYAEALQFQEALMASLITDHQNSSFSSSSSSPPPPPPALLCIASLITDHQNSSFSSSSSSPPPPPSALPCIASSSKSIVDVTVLPKMKFATEEASESSSIIICEICAEAKMVDEMFKSQKCYHSFCTECVTKHVATKIQENITVVPCPGLNCKGLLELDVCRSLLPKEVIDRWDDALCEALLLSVPKFYCPFKDCSAMLLDENEGGEEIRESECPFCHRLFCATCHVPWHPSVDCDEFQKLNVDERGIQDLLVRELANQKKWKRCPKCKFYIEKFEGCLHITCRCRFEFCYACGEKWTSNHGGCQRN